MRKLLILVFILGALFSAVGDTARGTDWSREVEWRDSAFLDGPPLPGGAFTEADYLPPLPDCGLLWHYNTPIHWIRYAEIGDDAQHLFAGGTTYTEDVVGFSMFKMNGEGEPAWQYWEKGGQYAVCAARDADIFYGGFTNAMPGEPRDTFKIYKFHALSRTPDWTYDALAAGYYPFEFLDWYGNVVSCSDDGSVMSIMVSDGDSLAVLFFGPDSPEPFQVFEDESSPLEPWLGGPRRTTLSPDGSKCVFGNEGTGYFLDVESCTLDGTWDTLPCMWLGKLSPDGTVSVSDYPYRYSPIRVRRWNGEEFEFLWSYDLPGENMAWACGISRDNQRIVVGWSQTDSNQIVLTGFDIDDPNPVWTYESDIYRDELDNYCTDIEMSADGEWIVVGTTGISDSGPPETWVFEFSAPEEPGFTIDNRGAVLSVYITPDGRYMSSVSQSVNHGWCEGDCDIYAAYLDPAADLTPVSFTAESAEDGVLVRWEAEEGRGVRLRRVSGDAVGNTSMTDEFLPLSGTYLDRDAEAGRTYRYYLRVYADDALFHEFGPVEVECFPTGEPLALAEPFPNPAETAVTIAFNLPEDGAVELCVYDLAGRRVDILVAGDLAAGRHEASWDAGEFPAGVYLVRLATDYGSLTRRLVVAR